MAAAVLTPLVVGGGVLYWLATFVTRQARQLERKFPAADRLPAPNPACDHVNGFAGLEALVADSPLEIAELGDWQATLIHPPTGRTIKLNAVDWCNGYGPMPGALSDETGKPVPSIHLRNTEVGLPAWFAVPKGWRVTSLDVSADGRTGFVKILRWPGLDTTTPALDEFRASLEQAWGEVIRDGEALVSPDRKNRIVPQEANSLGYTTIECLFKQIEPD